MSRLPSRWTPYLMAALVTLSPLALAQGGWIDKKTGQAVPDTEQAKSIGGFSASLLVTTDPDWQAKWETSPDTTPNFNTASEIAKGEALFILTFLANPKLDKAGMTDVSCDFVLSKPDGSRVFNEMDLPCFKTKLTSEPTLVYLSPANMKFVAEAEDPSGKWEVAITVKDRLRGVSIPLRTSFSVR